MNILRKAIAKVYVTLAGLKLGLEDYAKDITCCCRFSKDCDPRGKRCDDCPCVVRCSCWDDRDMDRGIR